MAENLDEIYLKGREAFDGRDFDEAERCFAEVLKVRPYADIYNKLGQIYHGRGELGKAATSFKKALEIN
ncbi:MAG TPA: tetratricopeptide repeat protein, partial [Nitrospirota bacterium]